ncbi:MAG: hypothetical protein GPJ54_03195 [Candidatus Heimdallarchaeota archaeon]|nr:hypothetical protein [Candidatus Heimdallarchaeota archaeon]
MSNDLLFLELENDNSLKLNYDYEPKAMSPAPNSYLKYLKSSTMGHYLHNLDNVTWQEWQETDVGLNTGIIDSDIIKMQIEQNNTLLAEKLGDFNTIFYEKLLYSIPLVSPKKDIAIWDGYENYDVNEGLIRSLMLGSYWSNNPSRTGNQTHLNIPFRSSLNGEYLNLTSNFDDSNIFISDLVHDSLLYYDKNSDPHPAIAYNYHSREVNYDHDKDIGTPPIPVQEYTYYLGNESFWSPVNFEGINYDKKKVNANDFALALDFITHPLTNYNSKYKYSSILDYGVITSVFENDTLIIRINKNFHSLNDEFNLGNIKPLPYHLLGEDLTLFDGNIINIDNPGFNPQDTLEWNMWNSLDNHRTTGQFELVSHDDESYDFKVREDYWYPSENKSSIYFPSVLVEEILNNNKFNISVFAPHLSNNNNEYYWVDPIHKIQTISLVLIDNTHVALQHFESGKIDIFNPYRLGQINVEKFKTSENHEYYQFAGDRNPILLNFDLTNPHLKKFAVRKAIAHVLDKEKFINIYDGFAANQESVISIDYPQYHSTYTISYDYITSRDLMRAEGYQAIDTNDYVAYADIPLVTDVIDTDSFDNSENQSLVDNVFKYRSIISGVLVILLVVVLRKRFLNN